MNQISQVTSVNKITKIKDKIIAKKIEILKNVLPIIIRYLSKLLSAIDRKKNIENPDQFEDFGPVILTEDEDKHSSRIKYAIDNPIILNLALTGPMGSGKSTILRTFENKHKEFKCLNISLATFDEKKLDTDKIELNILKQLFYSVERSRIPESRFKRIENLKGIKLKTFFFILWLCSLAYFVNNDIFNVLKESLHVDYYSGFLSILYGLYFTAYSFVLIYRLMSFILNFKLSKFKIKDIDFESDQDKKTVNFENEIDEILYFFERNPVEIVFFQDLDRFNKTEIFIKLREINNLINNYEPIKKKRKVTFIYAVCDDIFKENERAKFFDFIIPVIPVINYTSSSSKFLSKLKQDVISKKLSKDFIDDVSLFLNDYRTIKSIFNEFQIYKSIIGNQLESYNNLLAMMIYKNLEPTDFENLNIRQGYVYNVIENSKDLTSEKIKELQSRIEELNAKIEVAKSEKLKDIKELRMVYILKFCELNSLKNDQPVYAFHLDHKKVGYKEILTKEFFDRFTQQNNIQYYYSPYSSNTSASISFADIEKSVDRQNYKKRLQTILDKQADNNNILRLELEETTTKHRELNSKKLYEVLDSANSAAYFRKHAEGNGHLNNFKLVNYLLRGGFINEEYNHYISHFHAGSIAKEDNDFLLSLLPSEKSLPYNHGLKEVGSLFKRIKAENFSNPAVLNLTLTDFLIENKKLSRLNQIIDIMSKEALASAVFMDEYMNYADEEKKAVFFRSAAQRWTNLWNYISVKSNFPPEKIELYLRFIFRYLDQALISGIDKGGSLSMYIATMEDLSCFYHAEAIMEPFKEYVLKNKIRFENLLFFEEHKDLYEYIYNNSLYAINEEMIEFFIANFNVNSIDLVKLQTENYTAIKSSGRSLLIKYVDENLDLYLENVFLKLENNSNESQERLCEILNNEAINYRFDFIEQGSFKINDLSEITNSDIQAALIIYGKIDTTWNNLLSYYKMVKSIDETLVDYLNLEENYTVLSSEGLIKESDEKVKSDFSYHLIESSISNESFKFLASCLPYFYGNAEQFNQISHNKMNSMVVAGRIKLTEKNFTFIKEKYNDILISLLESKADEAVKEIDKFDLDGNILFQILKSGKFTSVHKIKIIKKTQEAVLVSEASLLKELGSFLTVNKIDSVTFVLLDGMVTNAETAEHKAELANQYFNVIEDGNLKEIMGKIEEFSKLVIGKRPKIENNALNQNLAKKLQGKLVSKIKPIEEGRRLELIPFTNPRI